MELKMKIDIDDLAAEIYDIILDKDMEKQIVKAKIVPCMKGSRSVGTSRVKLILEDLIKTT